MEGRHSFVSSRSSVNDRRSVPNIVAVFERPRHKIRRDATHVLGGMFGWNTPEETERSLRAESSRAEEEAAATLDSATPVDSGLAGPSQRCIKKPAKRTKRRGFAPLVDMGTSILSLRFQERLRRQHRSEEIEDSTPIAALAKRPIESPVDIPTPSTVTASASKKARISVPTGDAPIAKKLRLTISTAPPIDASLSTTLPTSFLQMPPSPPDTSSNASRGPAEEPTLVSASTTNDVPLLPDFDATIPFDPLDSESESESSSDSSSDLDSDSPDLSSSTSTRSAVQNQGKANPVQKASLARGKAISASPAPVPAPDRGPSTPPRRKRAVHKPGWIGWVQTEESPDHSRLIRLDDAPVILGRRTRSGKEFHDPPPLPPSRRKSIAAAQPKIDQPPRPRPKPTRKGKKSEAPTGEKSKQQTAWQEAQKRAANGMPDDVEGTDALKVEEDKLEGDELEQEYIQETMNGDRLSERTDGELLVVPPSEQLPSPAPALASVSSSASVLAPSQEANKSSPRNNTRSGSASSVPLALGISPTAPSAPVLKLTRSDAVIAPTAGRPDDPSEKENNKKDTTESNNKNTSENNNKGTPATQKGEMSAKSVSGKSRANATDQRETSRTSPLKHTSAISKGFVKDVMGSSKANDVSAHSKKSLTATKSDQSRGVYIALKKPRPSMNGSTKPSVSSRTGPTHRRSGWGSDTSAGEASSTAVNLPRTGSPSPPEKVKRPAPATSISSHPTPSSSGTRPPAAMSTKSGGTQTTTSSSKPTGLSAERQLLVARFGKSIQIANASALGKRKEPVAQASSAHFKKRKLSRKLVASSSDESDAPRTPFAVNPFERRAKQMELTRKGVSGDAFRHEMEKWTEMKRAEWKAKAKGNARDSEKSGSDGKATGSVTKPPRPVESGSEAVTNNSTSKSSKDVFKASEKVTAVSRDALKINDLPRIPKNKDSAQSDHAGTSPKIQKMSKLVWNGDWGMDVHQVSISSGGDAKNKFKKVLNRREPDNTPADRRDGDSGERRMNPFSNQNSRISGATR
ncbi:hypothetical protein FRC07_014394 [Ceratobasidium sp. 392]|nr:hypothetical protein FRC07_014394 [Ceratobasidium sp. 392]